MLKHYYNTCTYEHLTLVGRSLMDLRQWGVYNETMASISEINKKFKEKLIVLAQKRKERIAAFRKKIELFKIGQLEDYLKK